MSQIPAARGFANTSTQSPFASLSESKPSVFGSAGVLADSSVKSPFAALSADKSKADQPQTSASAFASSGFTSLAGSSQSPFAAVSAFNTNEGTTTLNGFGAPAGSVFGAPANAAPSPFAMGGQSVFGASTDFRQPGVPGGGFGGNYGGRRAFVPGGGFGGTPGGIEPKRANFALPGGTFGAAAKAAKAFGAADDEEEEEGEVADNEEPEKGLGVEEESVKDSRFYEQEGKPAPFQLPQHDIH